MKPSNPSRVLTLERGLQILEYIVERRNVTVTNVATAFGIQKSASHRFLNTLKYMGYVEQTPQSDYALTGRLRYLAEGVVPRIEVRNFARPYLEELSKAAEQPSNLGHWDGREITRSGSSIRRSKGMPRATASPRTVRLWARPCSPSHPAKRWKPMSHGRSSPGSRKGPSAIALCF